MSTTLALFSPPRSNVGLPDMPSSPKRTSSHRARLYLPQSQAEPPIPPRLIGSPLLNTLSASGCQRSRRAQQMWIDGDEFGAHSARMDSTQLPCPPGCTCGSNPIKMLPPTAVHAARLNFAFESSRSLPA